MICKPVWRAKRTFIFHRNSSTYAFFEIVECKDNTHGLGCIGLCGHCLYGDQCDHVNGSCPNGCDKGTYGDKCDKGLLIYICEFYSFVAANVKLKHNVELRKSYWFQENIFRRNMENAYYNKINLKKKLR